MGKAPSNTQVRFWRDSDLPGVEVRFSSYNEEAFRKHAHDAYSIGLVETGLTNFYLEGDFHTVTAGQMALIGPNAVHACNPDLESNMTYRMFYVDSPLLEEVARDVLGSEAGPPVFKGPVVDDPSLFSDWRKLHLAIIGNADRLEKQSRLIQCIADLLSRHALPVSRRGQSQETGAVKVVREHLARNLSEKITLDELSRLAGLSRYHFLRSFQQKTGLPPHAYQNQLRVERGKALLAGGMAISRVAVEVGFTDQSHFTRVFKQFTGATPNQYQSAGD